MNASTVFTYLSPDDDANGVGRHLIIATDQISDQVVGEMSWYSNGDIADISVSRTFRRRGIATGMYNYAFSCGVDVFPVHVSDRTDAGELWANSLGEDIPPRAPINLCPHGKVS